MTGPEYMTSDPIQSEAMRKMHVAGDKADREERKTRHHHGAFHGGKTGRAIRKKKQWEADLENQDY